MDIVLTATEIWQLAVIKLLFYLFIVLGLFFWFKIKKPILFVILIGSFLATTYLVAIHQSILPWWGLQGDEIFVTAFLEKVAAGYFWSDFFYQYLPNFYPPLYFWVVGALGLLFKLNGVVTAQLGVTLVLFITPILVYVLQKLYWQKNNPSGWQLAIASATIFIVIDWTAIILKPYEFISAVLVVFWTAFLLTELYYKTLNYKKNILYGISGGLLFLTFHFWFLPVILSILLFKLFVEIKLKNYLENLLIVAVSALAVSLPFTWPLFISYLAYGTENFQPIFFVTQELNLYLPFIEFSIFGLVSLIGLITLVVYFNRPYIKALGLLLISTYLWQLINIGTLIIWQVSFLPAKPFLFLGGAIFSVAAAYGIAKLILINNKKYLTPIFIVGWIILASQLLGGSFFDDPAVQKQLVKMKQPLREEFVNLIGQLSNIEGINDLTILSSGIPELSAYLPLNYYISYNMHFSHPAANYTKRFLFISELASSKSEAEFYQRFITSPYEKIDAMLLLKGIGFYPINFWLDDYPSGGKNYEIMIPAYLINEQYFVKVFEDKHFILFKPR